MNSKSILEQAITAPSKQSLEGSREAIEVLRSKGYTWRDISEFLNERGIDADHTKIYRFMKKMKRKGKAMNIPSSESYKNALSEISITENQRALLKAHFSAHNRSATYTELGLAIDNDNFQAANSQYGKLGHALGDELGFEFMDSDKGQKFYSSALGMPNDYSPQGSEFELVMHHELAKAISDLGWF